MNYFCSTAIFNSVSGAIGQICLAENHRVIHFPYNSDIFSNHPFHFLFDLGVQTYSIFATLKRINL